MQKLIHLIIFTYFLSSLGWSTEPPKIPSKGFESLKSLDEFSRSTFGGGAFHKMKLGEKNVYFVWRRFTSGLPSTECVLLTEELKIIFHMPLQLKIITAKQVKDTIEIYDNTSGKSDKHMLTFTENIYPKHLTKP
ncbi:MAG: hypothetical protein HQL32_02690 [Planctomycetes bacterium]|nr:hypothetical protein [Planctomycetota bacterium]